jgi:hypothetical protein
VSVDDAAVGASPDASTPNFTLSIANVNEAPTNVALSKSTIGASSQANSVIGSLAALDPDFGDTATFTLTNNAGGLFSTSGSNLIVASSLSGVTTAAQQITVRATDAGGLTFDKQFTITITGITAGQSFIGDAPPETFNGTDGNDTFDGRGGNDTFNGGAGQDIAVYNNDGATASGITVNLAAGTVAGDASIGNDTLHSIEQIRGTNFADTMTAAGFTTSTANAGSLGVGGFLNSTFEGLGGDDVLTGNGRTTASYARALDGVTVQLSTINSGTAAAGSAHGTAAGDVAGVGNDTLNNIFFVTGSQFVDVLTGGSQNDAFTGGGGNDTITGGGGFDIAIYQPTFGLTTTTGITVNMSSGQVIGDSSIGTDTLLSIESIRGTNFADTYNAAGAQLLTSNSTNAGNGGGNLTINGVVRTFNEFEGMGGNDLVNGNGNTRVRFDNATGPVSVDLAAGTASGDSSVGSDTITSITETINNVLTTYSGVSQVRGSSFNDTILGSNTTVFTETFDGWLGDDFIDGRGGFDQVTYANVPTLTGISVNMTTGVVTGDAAVGTDTLRGIEQITGTNFADIYDATNFGLTGFLNTATNNVGSNGTFNAFIGLGGNDTITGNGNTQVNYSGVTGTAGITVNLATGTAFTTGGGDAAGIGTDTITVGTVNNVVGTNNNDVIIGGSTNDALSGGGGADNISGGTGSDNITGGGGADTIDGGAGGDMATFSGPIASYTISMSAGSGTVADNRGGSGAGPDGTDNLTSIELLQFSDAIRLIVSGAAGNSVDASGLSFNGTLSIVSTTGTDDYLTVGPSVFNRQIDLGSGNDTVTITSSTQLNLANVENVVGTNNDDFLTLVNLANGLSINLAGGNDFLSLASGNNSISVNNVENINGSDFGATAVNDSLTLLNNVSGVSVSLGNGTNTVQLAAGANSFGTFNSVQTILGTTSDDTLTVTNGLFTLNNDATVDLGAGTNDILTLGTGFFGFKALGIEHVTAGSGDTSITFANNVSGIDVDLGSGNDTVNLTNGTNSIGLTNVESVSTSDYNPTSPSNDVLTLLNNVSGLTVNLQNGDNTLYLHAGTNSFDNLWNVQHLNGSGLDDTVTVGTISNVGNSVVVDLGAGNDTLTFGSMFQTLTALNVEHIIGNAQDNGLNLSNNVTGLDVDLGGGTNDFINVANGANSLSLTNVENVSTTDFGANPSSDDSLTFLNNVTGVSIDLHGGHNTLNLAAGASSLANVWNVQQVNGTDFNDTLTLTNGIFPGTGNSAVIDLGDGNDTLNFTGNTNVFDVTVNNVENINGSSASETIILGASTGTTTIAGGVGGDFITASAGVDHFRFNSVADSTESVFAVDNITNFDAAQDRFEFHGSDFAGVSNFTYIGTAGFSHHAGEVQLATGFGHDTLQIDIDGDGTMGAGDMSIYLINHIGVLSSGNFLIV